MSSPYAELHCLTHFSFLRGASHPEDLVERAHALGYAALAITDECSVSGVVRAHLEAKRLGLKLIVGTEVALVDGPKLVLLATDREGYGRVCALITDGRRSAVKGAYRLGCLDLADGLPGCLVLVIPKDPRTVASASGADPLERHARSVAERFPGRAWLAVELHRGPDDRQRLLRLRELGKEAGLPLVAAGDVHMHACDRRALQDTLTAIRLKTTIDSAGDALFPNGERHLRDSAGSRPSWSSDRSAAAGSVNCWSRGCSQTWRIRSHG